MIKKIFIAPQPDYGWAKDPVFKRQRMDAQFTFLLLSDQEVCLITRAAGGMVEVNTQEAPDCYIYGCASPAHLRVRLRELQDASLVSWEGDL